MNSTDAQLQNRLRIRACENTQDLAGTAAQYVLDKLAAFSANHRRWCIALSGGRIAPLLFHSMVNRSIARGVSWAETEFFFADERWVPLDNVESNYGLARRYLFDPLKIDGKSVHPIYLGRSPEFDAAQAQAELLRRTPVNVRGDPVLDLVVLGMGEDGHIASLFPNAPDEILQSRAVYLPVIAPKPPPQRITLTYTVLTAASDVVVVVSGPGKEPALRESISNFDSTPLGRLIAMREQTVVLTDFRFEQS